MPKKKSKEGKPQVHEELKGFEIKINEFGQITSNMDVEEINDFLNDNVEDKKLKGRTDLEENSQEQEKNEEDKEKENKDKTA